MSEPHIREVMSSGAWFHPVHPDLIVDSGRAQEVMFQFINFNCVFLDGAPIRFGNRVMAGPGCMFLTPLHPMLAAERYEHPADGSRPLEWERELPVTVEDDVWFGAGVIVNPGVTIGTGSVIGSGSVVTRDVPPNVFAAGNPCRVIRVLNEDDACGLPR